jgi:hypothetical protein
LLDDFGVHGGLDGLREGAVGLDGGGGGHDGA